MPSHSSLIVGDGGFRADGSGVQAVEPEILRRAIEKVDGVEMRAVKRGHPLFGPACELIRAEALIRIDCDPPLPIGLLALGQRKSIESRCAPRVRTADVPWSKSCGYDPQVVDEPAEVLTSHPAAELAARWASHLQHDRRCSLHTVRAYTATAHRLIAFLGVHRGQPIGPSDLLKVSAADMRAFLARRRSEGLGASSAARELSGVRAFLKYAADAGGKPCAAAADQGTTEAAHTSSPSRARRSARTCRERCGGGERAVDRCARSRNPASAIWCGSACCRGIVVDGADVARRRDP